MNLIRRNKYKVSLISTKVIAPNPNQPRLSLNDEKLKGLIQSIRKNGILQPLCAKQIDKNKYELIYGHRRLAAAKILELPFVPCLLTDCDSKNSFTFALNENLQRENLSFIEEAKAINEFINLFRLTQNEAALCLGISQPAIANKLRILKLSDKQLERIFNFSLTERHARALLRLPDEQQRDEVLNEIIVKNFTVEQTEKLIDNVLNPKETVQNSFVVKDIRLFINSINKAIKVMKSSGINAKSVKEEDENFIKYTVTIPKT